MRQDIIYQIPRTGRGSVPASYRDETIERMIYEFMEERAIPGLSLAIAQTPYISRSAGFGLSDIDEQRLASVRSVWRIGPLSQGFAAVAALQLIESDRMGLHTPLTEYIDNLPAEWNKITPMHLLQHSSGIADYRNAESYTHIHTFKAAELIALAVEKPLSFQPGSNVELSATNFLLLAEAIEKCSGMSYQEFVRRYQFNVLKIADTFFTDDLPVLKREALSQPGNMHERFLSEPGSIDPAEAATGYRESERGTVKVTAGYGAALKGFGDIWASTGDIARWNMALDGSILIRKTETRDLIHRPTRLDNGKTVPAMAGWQFPAHRGMMFIKGSSPGFSTFTSRFTDRSESICIVLLANREGVDFTNLARRIAATFGRRIGPGADHRELYTYESMYGVNDTMQRIRAELTLSDTPIFAEFDHGQNALKVDMDLRPTRVIVFGNPGVGTKLMQQNQSIAIELPLRISVWEDALGRVWIAFPQMKPLAERYDMEGNRVLRQMQRMLERLTTRAADIYDPA